MVYTTFVEYGRIALGTSEIAALRIRKIKPRIFTDKRRSEKPAEVSFRIRIYPRRSEAWFSVAGHF